MTEEAKTAPKPIRTRVRPWRWPSEWAKDEKFWREVTARALSGLIVIVVAYLVALALGYIRETKFLRSSYLLAQLAYLPTLLILLFRLMVRRRIEFRLYRWLVRSLGMPRAAASVASFVIEVVVGTVLFMLALFAGLPLLWLMFYLLKVTLGLDESFTFPQGN